MRQKLALLIMLVIISFLISGCKPQIHTIIEEPVISPEQEAPSPEPEEEPVEENTAAENLPAEETVPRWIYGGLAIEGKYADADFLDLGNDKYRMYYSPEPEVQGFKGQVYSAVSSDGVNWEKEAGERLEWATFPSVIKLPDGKYRMYFQETGVIKSAASSDGLSWKKEAGVRVDTSNSLGLQLENVAAPTVIKNDEDYILVYRGTISGKYSAEVPNNNIQLFFWAASKDGLAFEKKGLALDSRDAVLQGLADGPELVLWDDGSVKLFFWSYLGVYESAFTGEGFTAPKIAYEAQKENSMEALPSNPPGDPTLGKAGEKWHMYYGLHTQGIFYATLE